MLIRKAFTILNKSSSNSRRLLLNTLCYFASSNKNFYQILGVPQNASQSEIKSAYYKLAKQYHPDVNKGNEERFKEISSAYETLSAVDKRKNYDEMLKYGGGSSYSNQGQQYSNQQSSWQQQYQQYQQYYNQQQQQQNQSGADGTGRRKGFWEQYTEYYYDPTSNKYKARSNSQFYEDPNTAYYRQHQTFKEKQEYRDFKKKMEEEFKRAQEEYMRQGGQQFDEMAQLARLALLRIMFKTFMYIFGLYLFFKVLGALFGRKEYRVYDDKTGMVYVTEDKAQAEQLRRYGPPQPPIQYQPGTNPNPYGPQRSPTWEGPVRRENFNQI